MRHGFRKTLHSEKKYLGHQGSDGVAGGEEREGERQGEGRKERKRKKRQVGRGKEKGERHEKKGHLKEKG